MTSRFFLPSRKFREQLVLLCGSQWSQSSSTSPTTSSLFYSHKLRNYNHKKKKERNHHTHKTIQQTMRRPGRRAQRTPNVHFAGPQHFKHHQPSTRRRPERAQRVNFLAGGRNKKREILGRHPWAPPFAPSLPTFSRLGPRPLRAPQFGPPPFGPPPLWAPTIWPSSFVGFAHSSTPSGLFAAVFGAVCAAVCATCCCLSAFAVCAVSFFLFLFLLLCFFCFVCCFCFFVLLFLLFVLLLLPLLGRRQLKNPPLPLLNFQNVKNKYYN